MIYFRDADGGIRKVASDSLSDDLKFIQDQVFARWEIHHITGIKPKKRSAILVVVK